MRRILIAMRGSPVMQTFLLAIALLAMAVLLKYATSTASQVNKSPEMIVTQSMDLSVRYELTLSATPKHIALSGISGQQTSHSKRGSILVTKEAPVVTVRIVWDEPPDAKVMRFAKLRIDIPGRESYSHVFVSESDIDDVVELPEELLK